MCNAVFGLYSCSTFKRLLRYIYFMKKFSTFFSLVLFFSICTIALAGDQAKYKIFVGFINHFTKFVQWPDEKKTGDFVIGVLGDSPIIAELQALNGKPAGSQKIVVKAFASESAIIPSHILFVSEEASKSLSSVAAKAANTKTLIIAEWPGAAKKGADINFIEEGGSVKFEISNSANTAHGLKIASKLKDLGKAVD